MATFSADIGEQRQYDFFVWAIEQLREEFPDIDADLIMVSRRSYPVAMTISTGAVATDAELYAALNDLTYFFRGEARFTDNVHLYAIAACGHFHSDEESAVKCESDFPIVYEVFNLNRFRRAMNARR